MKPGMASTISCIRAEVSRYSDSGKSSLWVVENRTTITPPPSSVVLGHRARAANHVHRLAAVPRDLDLAEPGDLELGPALGADEEHVEPGHVLGLDPLRGPAPRHSLQEGEA